MGKVGLLAILLLVACRPAAPVTAWDDIAWRRCEPFIAGTSRHDFDQAPDHVEWLGEHGCPWLVMNGQRDAADAEAIVDTGGGGGCVRGIPCGRSCIAAWKTCHR